MIRSSKPYHETYESKPQKAHTDINYRSFTKRKVGTDRVKTLSRTLNLSNKPNITQKLVSTQEHRKPPSCNRKHITFTKRTSIKDSITSARLNRNAGLPLLGGRPIESCLFRFTNTSAKIGIKKEKTELGEIDRSFSRQNFPANHAMPV